MEEQVKLFVDLFNEEERTKQIGRLKKRIPIWKWIVRVLVIALLLWAGAVIFFDFEWDGFDELGQRKFKVTSPYLSLVKKAFSKDYIIGQNTRDISDYPDFDMGHPVLYFDDEPEEFKSYRDFDKVNEFYRPLHGNERLY